MPTAYVSSYLAIARNTSDTVLATALAAVPRDVAGEAFLGLQILTDETVTFLGRYARRTMSYAPVGPPLKPFASDPTLGDFLKNKYTATFSQAISTPVRFDGVTVVPWPLVPSLWVNAQFGLAGGAVTLWPSLVGDGNSLAQAVAINKPQMNPNGFAPNVATVSFDGVHSFVASSLPLGFDEFTYMLSFQSPALATAGILLERSVDATAHDGERLFQSNAPPSASILARRGGVSASANFGANWAVDGSWHVAAYVYSHAAGGKVILDGVTLSPTFAGLGAAPVSDTLFVGAESGPTLPFTGQLRELFAFGRALTDAQVAQVAAYMRPQVGL